MQGAACSAADGGRAGGARGDSTNGCAVIAPLVAHKHITGFAAADGSGVSDAEVAEIIDARAPPILELVRRRHGLPPQAFVIPSDVHDYLYDAGYIKHENFSDVYGGAIIGADGHLANLLDALAAPPASERRGVAFFFHEHVTAILKRGGGAGAGYDFIDSLPHAPAGVGVRIWCADVDALRACLVWYTTSKLTPSNRGFIDSTPWDDANCEFDPRVFQAYVWRTAPP